MLGWVALLGSACGLAVVEAKEYGIMTVGNKTTGEFTYIVQPRIDMSFILNNHTHEGRRTRDGSVSPGSFVRGGNATNDPHLQVKETNAMHVVVDDEDMEESDKIRNMQTADTWVDTRFDALSDQNQETSNNAFPPNIGTTNGAAGPVSIISTVSYEIEARAKDTGNLIFFESVWTMFESVEAVTNYRLGDRETAFRLPFIRYDTFEDRFVVLVLDTFSASNPTYLIAVSRNSNPRSTGNTDWFFHAIPAEDGLFEALSDPIGFAMDEEAVYITTPLFNIFNTNEVIRSLFILNKSSFYTRNNGSIFTTHDLFAELAPSGVPLVVNVVPAMVRSPNGSVGTYLVGNEIEFSSAPFDDVIQVIRVSDPLNGPSFTNSFINIGQVEDRSVPLPAVAPQLGSTIGVDVSFYGRRPTSAVWGNGFLWMTSVIRTPSATTAVFWVRVRTTVNGVVDPVVGVIDGDTIADNAFTFAPAIDVAPNGQAAVSFSATAPSLFIGSYVQVIGNDGLELIANPDTVRAGEAPYQVVFNGFTEVLWTPLAAMSLDPEDTDCFWTFQSYADDVDCIFSSGGCWRTSWARLCTDQASQTTFSPTISPTTLPNMVDVLLEQGLDRFVAILEAVGIANVIVDMTDITLFAPTNRAFDELDSALLNFLLSDDTRATNFILHHFVQVAAILSDDINSGDVTFLDVGFGEDIPVISIGASIVLNPRDDDEARIIEADLISANGPVHVIDSVLVSQELFPPTPAPAGFVFPTPPPIQEMPVAMPGMECDLCFLSNPLTWNMAQTLSQQYGCNLASIETERERDNMTSEITRHLLAKQYWAGGTLFPGMTCMESGMELACSNPLRGPIEVVLEVTTADVLFAGTPHLPLVTFFPLGSTGDSQQFIFPSRVPNRGNTERYTFVLNDTFGCGVERIEIAIDYSGTSTRDQWLLAGLMLEFGGETFPIDLTVNGVEGVWLDGEPFADDSIYEPFAFSDNFSFECNCGILNDWVWVDGTPFSGNFWAPGEPGTQGSLAVGIDPATGNAAFFDEASSTTLPSVWECCGGCPQDLC